MSVVGRGICVFIMFIMECHTLAKYGIPPTNDFGCPTHIPSIPIPPTGRM